MRKLAKPSKPFSKNLKLDKINHRLYAIMGLLIFITGSIALQINSHLQPQQHHIHGLLWLLIAEVSVVGLALAWLLGNSITDPLQQATAKLHELVAPYSVEYAAHQVDEIKQLTNTVTNTVTVFKHQVNAFNRAQQLVQRANQQFKRGELNYHISTQEQHDIVLVVNRQLAEIFSAQQHLLQQITASCAAIASGDLRVPIRNVMLGEYHQVAKQINQTVEQLTLSFIRIKDTASVLHASMKNYSDALSQLESHELPKELIANMQKNHEMMAEQVKNLDEFAKSVQLDSQQISSPKLMNRLGGALQQDIVQSLETTSLDEEWMTETS